MGGGKKKAMKPKGTATAQTKNSKPTSQKPKSKRTAITSHKNNKPSPADRSNVSTTAAKNPKEKKPRIKSSGNRQGKKTAARK